MIKILFLIPNLAYGGAEKVLVNLVNNMDRTRFDITVQTMFDEGINKQYLKKDIRYKTFMRHQFHGNSPLFAHLPANLLYRIIVKEKYDVVVSFLEGPTAHIITGCPYKETKKVAWFHTAPVEKSVFSVGFTSVNQAIKSYDNMDKFIFVSEDAKDITESTLNHLFYNGKVLYNVNQTDLILNKSSEPIENVVFDSTVLNVISVGKIQTVKGYDRLAHVHKCLIEEGIKHHIYILGVGEQQAEIQKYLDDNNLNQSFTFLGFCDNPYKYVAAADLYVCSSRREGFSTAVTESLIVGTPVVSTCCSGARELLGANNEYGIVVDNSEEGIYQGVKKMLTDRDLREHYAQTAKERGKQFSTEKTVKAVEDMLIEVCNER